MLTGLDARAPTAGVICGICEKKGGDTVWVSKVSHVAHRVCVGSMIPVEQSFLDTASYIFGKTVDPERNLTMQAISIARETVRTACLPCTIAQYLEKNGRDQLSALFISEGLNAALVFKEGVEAASQLKHDVETSNRENLENNLRARL